MSPGTLDAQTVRRHLVALDRIVAQLRRHAGRSVAQLAGDLDELWAVERGLQLAAQNCIDIATHVLAAGGRDVPDYQAAIGELSAIGVLPAEFAEGFKRVAGFRNVLVHGYLDIDVVKLHEVLNQRLADFVEFAGNVQLYLGRAG